MRKPGGYAVIFSPDATSVNYDRMRCEEVIAGATETDTFTCVHCNRVIHVKPRAPMDEFGSMCRNCMQMVCPACADGPCTPFMKKLEEAEQRSYLHSQYQMVMNS